MGISFFPRGGSAQVVRYLARALPPVGWQPRIFTGSLGPPGAPGNARGFYGDLDLVTVDFTDASEAARTGGDPMAAAVPVHPSFEDREGAPDLQMTALDDRQAERQVDLWARTFLAGGARECDVVHLHHLSAQHEAAARAMPGRPVVAHLHGTELKMIDGIRRRRELLDRHGTSFEAMATGSHDFEALSDDEHHLIESTRWPAWRHSDAWNRRLVDWAHRASHVICISDHDRREAVRLLGLHATGISVIANGVDTARFDEQRLSPATRHRLWRRWLIDEPLGWDVSGKPGSRRCTRSEFETFFPTPGSGRHGPPVMLFVGRYLSFKRVPLLVAAYARARSLDASFRSPLVLWGGNPGEWEGEHPAETVDRLGIDGVFFVGWRDHGQLPTGICCADVMVAPSFNEPFGQVYLEAMACGRPVIATRTGGPVSFVNTVPGEPNGWLVPADDTEALASALIEAAADNDERERRAHNAYHQIRHGYAWSGIAHRFAELYEALL